MNFRIIVTALFAVLVIVLPWLIPSFLTFEFTYVGAYTIAILGLVILIGNSGQISLGHGAFVAVGGYTVAVLLQNLGLPYGFSLPIAALVCGLLGIALGAVALRLESVYLALATFALAASVSPLLKRFKHLTGGVQGISMPSAHAPPALAHVMSNETWFYYLTWGIAAVLFALAFKGLHGRVGRSLRAIRDSEIAAIAFGVNPVLYKTLAFGWSAAYAGVAGALLAIVTAYVSPDVYGIPLSLTLLAGVVMGGLDLMWGAVIGGIAIEFLPLWAQRVNPALSSVVYGLAEIAIMMFMPIGIAGALMRIKAARL
ncbi:MAG: branched-chain amino acid ABC transporter permease [Vulcanimicrobiaceae bacterium]|jgi:branched-chain amino acid transport system permease protein